MIKYVTYVIIGVIIMSCTNNPQHLEVNVYETSADGNKLTLITNVTNAENPSSIILNPDKELQSITGFGGAFTESSAYLLNRLSKQNRQRIIDAYFSEKGAHYSLTRTHMNSCDFLYFKLFIYTS